MSRSIKRNTLRVSFPQCNDCSDTPIGFLGHLATVDRVYFYSKHFHCLLKYLFAKWLTRLTLFEQPILFKNSSFALKWCTLKAHKNLKYKVA